MDIEVTVHVQDTKIQTAELFSVAGEVRGRGSPHNAEFVGMSPGRVEQNQGWIVLGFDATHKAFQRAKCGRLCKTRAWFQRKSPSLKTITFDGCGSRLRGRVCHCSSPGHERAEQTVSVGIVAAETWVG